MLILGWHGGWRTASEGRRIDALVRDDYGHDASAVVLQDHEIVAAIEEERLSRVKHTKEFPARAIRFCLREAKATFSDVDVVVMDTSEQFIDTWVARKRLFEFDSLLPGGRSHIAELFKCEFGADVKDKLRFCDHHLAHVHACWHASGYERALIVCLDGEGDWYSGVIAHCSSSGLKVLRHIPVQQSLGYLYLRCISILGYRLFDEYKVMGLAAHGDPARYRDVLSRMYRLLSDGRFALVPDEERMECLRSAGLTQIARRRGEPFSQAHRDFAASIQEALETIVIHIITHFQRSTDALSLGLCGGVAHNCSMNGKILRSRSFRNIFVHPAAHDAGNALGAALSVVRENSTRRTCESLTHVYLGGTVGTDDTTAEHLARWSPLIEMHRMSDACAETARLIAGGGIVGWVQGRSEFGPRALGNRSILADPRPAENKRIVNEIVKKRESFRPFAPSVLHEHLRDFFDVPEGVAALPFMTFAVDVRRDKRELLGAITHVDGTARVQSVEREVNPRFYELITEFYRLTGIPLLLNTSFNNDAEPIVESVDDAVATFLCTALRYLVVGNWLVAKPEGHGGQRALLDLVPSVPEGMRVVIIQESADVEPAAFLEFVPDSTANQRRTQISIALMNLLVNHHDRATCAERCQRIEVDPVVLAPELFLVWQARSIVLRPR